MEYFPNSMLAGHRVVDGSGTSTSVAAPVRCNVTATVKKQIIEAGRETVWAIQTKLILTKKLQILYYDNSVLANGSPPLRHFYERNWLSRRNDAEMGLAISLNG